MAMSRRLKMFPLPASLFESLFRGEWVKVGPALPPEVQVHGVSFNAFYDGFLVTLSHPEWPEIPFGKPMQVEELVLESVPASDFSTEVSDE